MARRKDRAAELLMRAARGPSFSPMHGDAISVEEARRIYRIWSTTWLLPGFRLIPELKNASIPPITDEPDAFWDDPTFAGNSARTIPAKAVEKWTPRLALIPWSAAIHDIAQSERPKVSAAERWLDAIYHDVHAQLNPNDDECWNCGGEGATYDCIDGCCEDPESGCSDCARPCIECRLFEISVRKAVRLEVLRALDIDLAIAFLAKTKGSAFAKLSRDAVLMNIHAGRTMHAEFTAEERADSACWVEGLR
jgi:hypothetical protein